MNFKKANNIVGWVVCLIACTAFILTTEKSGSFWDCGEFVSSCFKVQIPHPPGAPLFVLIGRFFIILFGNDPLMAAKAVNIMSALSSGFAVLFLFWTITHFARKLVQGSRAIAELTQNEIFMIMSAGVVGALAFCFSDSFWYSAVEGEVYALSAFFTALVFWAILKWEHIADEPGADRWIVFIFFMMGLAVGVHLLNLLTIPSIVMIFYFRKRQLFDYKKIRKYFIWIMIVGGALGFIASLIQASSAANSDAGIAMDATVAMTVLFGAIIAIAIVYLIERFNKDKKDKKELYGGAYIFFVFSAIILGFVQVGVIQQSINAAGHLDIFFVNNLNLPLFSGFIFFFVLVAVLIWWALRVANKKNWYYIKLGLWCLAFLFIGFSSYLTTMIRSTANPSVDMFNVDNPMSLVGYLNRSQYGDFPLLYGQKFTAQPIAPSYGGMQYQKSTDDAGKIKYVPVGRSLSYVYSPDDMMLFPRVWNNSTDRNQTDFYAGFLGIDKDPRTGQFEREPNFIDNMKFYVGYQNYYMFFRYFMWNYSGRQNDLQGNTINDVRDGNWITGIPFIDNLMLGDQSKMPYQLKINKAHNVMFALPFILGLIGMFYQFKRKGDDALITFLLFFMTGFAIIIYLNQAGNEPRERDYAYAGSTYAFAIWIGIGVFKVRDWLQKLKNISPSVAATIASAACFIAVPVRMVQQEWDDHDRSNKLLPPDMAKDYLNSCAPNAILFTFGDNDTYPLWYAQEVEHVRPDIRIINTSLLGIDWYINDLRTKVNESDSIDVIFSRKQIEGNNRNQVAYMDKKLPQDRYYDLYDMLKNYVGSDDPSKVEPLQDGSFINTFPVKNLFIPVDTAFVRKNGTVNPTDSVVDAVRFTFPKNNIFKNDLAELAIIAANKWKRPIYFSMNQQIGLGIDNYLRQDGLAYRLVPVAAKDASTDAQYNKYGTMFGELLKNNINADEIYTTMMDKFVFGNADIPGVYFDEENRRHLITIREAFADAAIGLVKVGKHEEAQKLLEKADHMMSQQDFPYGMPSKYGMQNQTSFKFLIAAYMVQDQSLIQKVSNSLRIDLDQEINYFNSLSPERQNSYGYEIQGPLNVQQMRSLIDTLANLDKAPNPMQRLEMGDSNTLQMPDTGKK
ncbi:MAG TPA: DUF2723 domain-containing protein [Arachidicoccus sp.]